MWAEIWHAEMLPSWNDKPQIYCSSHFFFFLLYHQEAQIIREEKANGWTDISTEGGGY